MSSEQYSPLDTTLPFFSNQVIGKAFTSNAGVRTDFILPFLLKFKGIARRVKITVPSVGSNSIKVYFNGDLENPSTLRSTQSQVFTKWIRSLRITNDDSSSIEPLIEYDVVPVEYLPPRTRVG